MSPRSTLSLALCACLGLAGTASAQLVPNGAQRPGREEMQRRVGIPILVPRKVNEYKLESIAEVGKTVKRGDIVFTLRSAELEKKLADLTAKDVVAKAEYESAKLDRQILELRLREFVDGIKRLEVEQIHGEIAVAEMEKTIRVENVAALQKQGGANAKASLAPLQLEVLKANVAYEQALGRKRLMMEYTHPLRQKELEAAVEKAKATEFRLRAVSIQATADQKALEEETSEIFRVRVPRDGVIRAPSVRPMNMPAGPEGVGPYKAGDTVQAGYPVFMLYSPERDKELQQQKAQDKPDQFR